MLPGETGEAWGGFHHARYPARHPWLARRRLADASDFNTRFQTPDSTLMRQTVLSGSSALQPAANVKPLPLIIITIIIGSLRQPVLLFFFFLFSTTTEQQ